MVGDGDEGTQEDPNTYFTLLVSLMTIFTSIDTQLEFITLTGVIFNAFMQGYLCANSIYVFLIENIESELLEFSKSTYSIAHDDESGGAT